MKDIEQRVYEMMCHGCEKEHLCHEKCITCEEFKEEVKKQQKKYIRTKDTIICVEKWFRLKRFCLVEWAVQEEWKYLKTQIVATADAIEELCDEFVVLGIFEDQIGCCCDTFKEAKELKDFVELPQEQIIYGAIWTDKGLIYVAKMNDKGELELL